MNTWMRNALSRVVIVFGLFISISAHAGIITGSGIDTATRHFVIDGALSTVTYNPGMKGISVCDESGVCPDVPTTQSYAVSGAFDAYFSRYWWTYHLNGDPDGQQGTSTHVENWLTFGNASIVGNIYPSGFKLPDYWMRVDASEFSGNDGACGFPFFAAGSDYSCTEYILIGSLASVKGRLENGTISLQGYLPISAQNLEGYSYSIQANVVPEPGMLVLLLSGLGAGTLAKRRKR